MATHMMPDGTRMAGKTHKAATASKDSKRPSITDVKMMSPAQRISMMKSGQMPNMDLSREEKDAMLKKGTMPRRMMK